MSNNKVSTRIDLTGQKFGKWTVLEYSHSKKSGAHWLCRCECGNERTVRSNALRSGKSTQCSSCADSLTKAVAAAQAKGCWKDNQAKATAASQAKGSWKHSLIKARSTSIIVHTTHGHSRTRTYRSWKSMIQRCTNPKSTNFTRYGGRGITVCDRWRYSFINFLADMGERPSNTSIDRIDVDGPYEKWNCRWATAKQQNTNKRKNKM